VVGGINNKIHSFVKTGNPLIISVTVVFILSIIRRFAEYSGLNSLLEEIITGTGITGLPHSFISNFAFFILINLVYLLVVDIPLFYLPVKWLVITRQVNNLNFLKFYTLYLLMVLFLSPWLGILYIMILQIASLYKILSASIGRYFQPTNHKYHWHIIFLVLTLVSFYVRLLLISLGT
jgi:hypothetical protein